MLAIYFVTEVISHTFQTVFYYGQTPTGLDLPRSVEVHTQNVGRKKCLKDTGLAGTNVMMRLQ